MSEDLTREELEMLLDKYVLLVEIEYFAKREAKIAFSEKETRRLRQVVFDQERQKAVLKDGRSVTV